MKEVDPATLRLRTNQCKTCPFKQENQDFIRPSEWVKIYKYLLEGTQHICHSTDKHICRGARNWQLNIWHRTGMINEPTDQSLHDAMVQSGEPPKAKDCDPI